MSDPIPRATYRLQFHKDFGFADAAALAPYLAKLGISHVYASPYLKARPGSTHGYDIVDHRRLNPELGDDDAFRPMVAAFRRMASGRYWTSCRTTWASEAPTISGGRMCWNGGPTRSTRDGSTSIGIRIRGHRAAVVGAISRRSIWSRSGSGTTRAALPAGDRRFRRLGLRHPQTADLPAALSSACSANSHPLLGTSGRRVFWVAATGIPLFRAALRTCARNWRGWCANGRMSRQAVNNAVASPERAAGKPEPGKAGCVDPRTALAGGTFPRRGG